MNSTQTLYSERLWKLERDTIKILRSVPQVAHNPAILWSTGKDSTTMLYLVKQAFGRIPYPVIHIDTGKKFPEIYKFREELKEKWNIPLKVIRNEEALKNGVSPETVTKFTCCTELKTNALKLAIKENHYDALILSIRHDEHIVRGMEDFLSLRDINGNWQYKAHFGGFGLTAPEEGLAHLRINAILAWTEAEVWQYVMMNQLPVNPLYFANSKGQRYRSLGCMPCTAPLKSNARSVREIVSEVYDTPGLERSGRLQDKENVDTMLTLMSLGYM